MEWTADEDAIVSNYVDNAQMQSNQTVFTGWECIVPLLKGRSAKSTIKYHWSHALDKLVLRELISNDEVNNHSSAGPWLHI